MTMETKGEKTKLKFKSAHTATRSRYHVAASCAWGNCCSWKTDDRIHYICVAARLCVVSDVTSYSTCVETFCHNMSKGVAFYRYVSACVSLKHYWIESLVRIRHICMVTDPSAISHALWGWASFWNCKKRIIFSFAACCWVKPWLYFLSQTSHFQGRFSECDIAWFFNLWMSAKCLPQISQTTALSTFHENEN